MSEIKIGRPRGTYDLEGENYNFFNFLRENAFKEAKSLGFTPIETPLFEERVIFERSMGNASDTVAKEMYKVERLDRGMEEEKKESALALRPEYTAGVVRAVLENGLLWQKKPLLLSYFGPVFRYNRPQKGRFRQFWQFGVEVLGKSESSFDALVIFLAWRILKNLGLEKEIVLEINSLGCEECRPKIKRALLNYYQKYLTHLCPVCQRRIKESPLRLLDCKEEKCQTLKSGAPLIVDSLCQECQRDFKEVLESLDDLGIKYDLNPHLVRGLDYYTKTTFEIRGREDERSQNSLLGGGRYDELVELLGGPKTPAVGFAMGVERVLELSREKGLKLKEEKGPDICLAQIGEKARRRILKLLPSLRQAGYSVMLNLSKDGIKSQITTADKIKAKLCLIMGQREVIDNTIILRNMDEGSQESINLGELATILKKKLKNRKNPAELNPRGL
ncbi:histidine--tRNA ligase [Candidatus Berkelbacteria bacterium]|nr:histidine--tRNA ligase [Candidatus Berkelbacteria bacterium]